MSWCVKKKIKIIKPTTTIHIFMFLLWLYVHMFADNDENAQPRTHFESKSSHQKKQANTQHALACRPVAQFVCVRKRTLDAENKSFFSRRQCVLRAYSFALHKLFLSFYFIIVFNRPAFSTTTIFCSLSLVLLSYVNYVYAYCGWIINLMIMFVYKTSKNKNTFFCDWLGICCCNIVSFICLVQSYGSL